MSSYEKTLSAKPFSHIYIEKEAFNYPLTHSILDSFKDSVLIDINHYKDVFNQTHQSFYQQKQTPALILAVKHGELIYPGAKVCQSFGNDHFYYTSNIMNCVFDCDYCYLSGMYPSGNIVIFVNQNDIFNQVDLLLKNHPVYLCVSYDTDLLAMEKLTGFVKNWTEFARKRPDLKIEIRTKSATLDFFDSFGSGRNIIFAWTLSPDEIISLYEHKTPSLLQRITSINHAIGKGYTIRLCFDPMIYVKDYEKIYSNMYKTVFQNIDASKILDVSLGLFRISSSYLKNMRKGKPSEISAYPYVCTDGVMGYEKEKSDKMLDFARREISKYFNPDLIFEI